MAHSLSAKKRIRTNEKRREINGNRMSRIRTFVKKTESAIAEGNKGAAEEAFKSAMPEMHRGVVKGIMHKNTVARKISRLSKRINAL
ncbi:MAG: 30S ribosomal protein S20 [Alphaproteobacteria bacterium]